VRSEVNPQFAAIVPPTDIVLVIVFEIDLEFTSGSVTISIPYSAIEPIIPKLKATFQAEEQEVDRVWIRRVREEMLTTEVEVVAELGKTDITSERLIQLKVGDTIMLGNDVTDPLTVKVQGMPKVKGFPGVSRGLKAIQVTEIIEREG